MTCKDCPHFDVCKMYGAFHTKRRIYSKWKNCPFRNDKAKYIELPCKIGRIVYVVDNDLPKTFLDIVEAIFCGFEINSGGRNHYFIKYKSGSEQSFGDSDIGFSIFFNKSEAEAKLEELNNGTT